MWEGLIYWLESDKIADIAITLRQSSSIRISDAMVAATPLYLKATLMTRNKKGFQRDRNYFSE